MVNNIKKTNIRELIQNIKIFFFDWWRFSKLRNIHWWFEHRFNPGYQYHKMNTGLKPGYYDPDVRILYAVMEEISHFFENTCELIDWNATESHQRAFMELLELYEYWEWRKNFGSYFESNECDHLENDNPKDLFDHSKDYYDCLRKLEEKDQEINKLDQEMLYKVIDIRFYMWYP